jgi:hypothetical protein
MPRRRRLDDDVPRLPRGRGMKLSTAQLVQIVMVAAALVAVIVLARPCSESVSRLVTSFDQSDAGTRAVAVDAAAAPAASAGVILRGDMTPAQLEAAIAKARAEVPAAPLDAGVVDAPAPR